MRTKDRLFTLVSKSSECKFRCTVAEDWLYVRDARPYITCCICYQIYTHPLMLVCQHSFCLECLAKCCTEERQESISCPLCRQITFFPSGLLSKIPKNLMIIQMMAASGLEDRNLSNEDITKILRRHRQTSIVVIMDSSDDDSSIFITD